jgi:predicted deacylase
VVDGYPIERVTLSRDDRLPTALVIAGTHGNEPSGVEAAVAFLTAPPEAYLRHLRFEVIPCLNPWGYVHDTRHNRLDLDLNWSYSRQDVPEIAAVRRFIAGRRFEAVVDLHEDWESPGFYLYELRREQPRIGAEIARRVAEVCPLNTSRVIEGLPASNGVIHPDPNRETTNRGAGIPIVLFKEHTEHLITTEAPTTLPLDVRVRTHLIALNTIIESHIAESVQIP